MWKGGISPKRRKYILAPIVPINSCNPLDAAWLAGIMEGEGSFCFLKNGKRKSGVIKIQIGMTDRDVIDRVAKLMENAPVYNLRIRPDRKPAYLVAKTGYAAERIMIFLRPMMGERRKSQIDESLSKWQSRKTRRPEWSRLILDEKNI
jgi:hypothetical protein